MLKLSGVNAYYGLSHVLQAVDLEVDKGEVVALLGRNGAGKSTTLSTIMGIVKKRSGSIMYNGVNLIELPPSDILRTGIGYVVESRGIFHNLSVQENLRMGYMCGKEKWSFNEFKDTVIELFPRLGERLRNLGKKLSGGEQQMLALARAMGAKPSLLMVDEPTEGLSPEYVDRIQSTISVLNSRGVSILLVENNIKVALALAKTVYFIEKGRILYKGSSMEVKENPSIRLRYLGVS